LFYVFGRYGRLKKNVAKLISSVTLLELMFPLGCEIDSLLNVGLCGLEMMYCNLEVSYLNIIWLWQSSIDMMYFSYVRVLSKVRQ